MKQRRTSQFLLFCCLAIFCLFVSGCATIGREEYSAPQLELPQNWTNGPNSKDERQINAKFWEDFKDPELNQLIENVLTKNSDILSAAIQVQQAILESGISKTDLYPVPSLGAGVSRNRYLDSGNSYSSYNLSAGISYEIDLWNKYADTYKAAQMEVEANIADRKSAVLSVIGQTAELYWTIAYYNQSISMTLDNIANARKLLKIVENKYSAGAVTQSDVITSQQNLLSLQANLTQERQNLDEARHALVILFDQPPTNSTAEPVQLADHPLPEVAAGVPADVLNRRPDLQAAELRLRKSHSEIGITAAGYYPTISLTGTLGVSSNQLRDFLDNPLASLGSDLVLPFLQWNKTKTNIQLAKEDYREAVISFRSALYTALEEVENLLSARANNLEQGEYLEQTLALAARTEQLSACRYNSGAEELSSLLEDKNALITAKKAVLENHLRLLTNTMQLYLALGGGQGNDICGNTENT